MEIINGIEAIRKAQEVSKIADGTFHIAFYPYNRKTGHASARLRVVEHCKTRTQLPQDVWEAHSDTYFLFQDANGEPKTAHRILTRFIGFPPDYKLQKIQWLK